MKTQTVRITRRTHEQLQELADLLDESMPALLARVVQEYRRRLLFEKANAAYSAMQENVEDWDLEVKERNLWDATLADGLNEESRGESETGCAATGQP